MADITAAKEAKAALKAEEKRVELEEKKKVEQAQPAKEIKKEKAAEPKKENKDEKKKDEKTEERILTVSLRKAWNAPRTKRSKAAMHQLREQLGKHLKREITIDKTLNSVIWARGITRPPSKVKVRAVMTADSAVAYPAK
ncbi:MAG: 50S ribosomal protein L31e [Candidatus Micrarchaeota archaeon]